jgi:hypothetical protein
MSKRNNVHPDHYKLAGRDRPGDAMPKPPKQQPRHAKGERNSGRAPGGEGQRRDNREQGGGQAKDGPEHVMVRAAARPLNVRRSR